MTLAKAWRFYSKGTIVTLLEKTQWNSAFGESGGLNSEHTRANGDFWPRKKAEAGRYKTTRRKCQGWERFWLNRPNKIFPEDRPGWWHIVWGAVGHEDRSDFKGSQTWGEAKLTERGLADTGQSRSPHGITKVRPSWKRAQRRPRTVWSMRTSLSEWQTLPLSLCSYLTHSSSTHGTRAQKISITTWTHFRLSQKGYYWTSRGK